MDGSVLVENENIANNSSDCAKRGFMLKLCVFFFSDRAMKSRKKRRKTIDKVKLESSCLFMRLNDDSSTSRIVL